MASISPQVNEKQILIILSMIRNDCIKLNAQYYHNRHHLSDIIQMYEEFIYNEINTIFKENNKFSDIIRNHRTNFNKTFLVNNCAETNGIGDNHLMDDSKLCLHISVQEWFLQGQKGHQFQYIVDIDCLEYVRHASFNDYPTVFMVTYAYIQMTHNFFNFIHYCFIFAGSFVGEWKR